MSPISPSTRMEGWIALSAATASRVCRTFCSSGKAERSKRIEPCLCDFLRARAGVRVVRIEKDREIKLIAKTLHQSCDLADSHKGPFTFGCANDHWHMYVLRSSKHCFQQNEVRDVEMPDGFTMYSRLAQDIPQRLHTKTLLRRQNL
jgi:hypothetical protein